jgi:hypothetical protein
MCSNIYFKATIIVLTTYLVAGVTVATVNNNITLALSPYDSGYKHGCSDAKNGDQYINTPGKGREFHTADFISGYDDGHEACSSVSHNTNDCYKQGFQDGKDHPFSQAKFKRCGSSYQDGFMAGCLSVAGNTKRACDNAQDA